MTTAQSLPLTPSDVMFAAVIALNAYSGAAVLAGVRDGEQTSCAWESPWSQGRGGDPYRLGRGDLGQRRW